MKSQRYEFAETILGHYMNFMTINESDFHLALMFENQNGLNINKQVKTVIKTMNDTEKQKLNNMKTALDALPVDLMADLLDKDIVDTTKLKQKNHMHILGNTNVNKRYDLTLYSDKCRVTVYSHIQTENIEQYEQELAAKNIEPAHTIRTKSGKLFGLSTFCDTNITDIKAAIDNLTEKLNKINATVFDF
jgi:hypothetical protein